MKLKTLQSICLSSGLSLAAASVAAAPFASPRGYTLNVPVGWHILPHLVSGDDANVIVNQPAVVAHRMTRPALQIQVRPVDAQMTWANMEEYNQIYLSPIRQRYPDLKVLSRTSLALSEVRDIDCVFTATVNGIPVRFHSVQVLRHLAVATFTCVCPEQIHAKYDPVFVKMLASVRWKA